MSESQYIFSGIQTTILDNDLLDADGMVIAPKGSRIYISPQVLDATVITEDDQTLRSVLLEMRSALSGYQAELIRLADRITQMQIDNLSNNGEQNGND